EHWVGHGDPMTQDTYSKLLADYLKMEGIHDPVLWLYTPMAEAFSKTIPHCLLIYDVMDQLSAFKGAPPEIAQLEPALLKRADLVFTGGVSLYEAKFPSNRHTYLFPSGVEIEHFSKAAERDSHPIPGELAGLEGSIIGYFGVIDERMDLELLAYIAAARPEWQIVLIGPVVKIAYEELPQAENLHYLGMRQYAELPSYLAHFDAALVPFAMNEATRFLSPTKTLEYLAAGKPVVSTPIKDVVDLYGSVVEFGETPSEFVAAIERLWSESPALRQLRLAAGLRLVAEHAWDEIAARMRAQIDAALLRRAVPDGSTLLPPFAFDHTVLAEEPVFATTAD
ncbi:MAG TPA: glycosyltransferase, partial [Thermomicrobiales bacterium]|nr:glycosyltransferase [Thermomicrobiales bacterium]